MNPLYGLVVCGGRSKRMGRDKSLLEYHGKPQRYFLHEMLQPLCEKVFLSCNKDQAAGIPAIYETLIDSDQYADIGPMGALLTALHHYPNADFLVVGCDYPFIKFEHLHTLSKVKLETILAYCYHNKEADLYEPLIGVYQSNILIQLEHYFRLNDYSLQKILKDIKAGIIIPDDPMIIKSIDIADEYEKVMMQLHNTDNDNAI